MSDDLNTGAPATSFRSALNIGSVLERSAATLGGNFKPFMVLALVLFSPPVIFKPFWGFDAPAPDDHMAMSGIRAHMDLSTMVTGFILTGVVTYGTILDLRGYPADFPACIANGLRAFAPVVAITVLYVITVVLGALLFIIPGFIVLVMFFVSVQVVVVERLGIFNCFSRSRELTRGSRWKIFALFVIIMLAGLIIQTIISALTGVNLYSGGMHDFSDGAVTLALLIDYLVNSIVAAYWAVVGAVVYHDLRIGFEGTDSNRIASVFD